MTAEGVRRSWRAGAGCKPVASELSRFESYDAHDLIYLGTPSTNRQRRARIRIIEAIRQRDGDGCCFYCGSEVSGPTLHIEHVTPTARGGSDHVENLVVACRTCNVSKGLLPGWFFMLSVRVAGLANDHSLINKQFAEICLAESAA